MGNDSKIVRSSQYARLVKDVLRLFPPENVLIIKFEKYVRNPLKYLEEKVLPFLGLKAFHDSTRERLITKQNSHSNPSDKQYKMLDETKRMLDNFYGEQMREMEPLFNDTDWLPE